MLAAARTIPPFMAWINEWIQSAGRIPGLCLSFAVARSCRSSALLRTDPSRRTLGNPNS
jgi:hypothetical protein